MPDAHHAATPHLSIVVPTYNERGRLAELVEQTFAIFASHGLDAELVIVDDNSPDGTGALADELALRHRVKVVHRPGKLGLGTAVIDGFAAATADVVGVMDADLSHPPGMIVRMLAAMRRFGADFVIGSRYVPGGGTANWSAGRVLMSRIACLMARPITPVRDATSGLFIVRRACTRDVRIEAKGFKICLELLVRGRAGSVVEVPYVFVGRTVGESKMNAREASGYLGQLWQLFSFRYFGAGRPFRQAHHIDAPTPPADAAARRS